MLVWDSVASGNSLIAGETQDGCYQVPQKHSMFITIKIVCSNMLIKTASSQAFNLLQMRHKMGTTSFKESIMVVTFCSNMLTQDSIASGTCIVTGENQDGYFQLWEEELWFWKHSTLFCWASLRRGALILQHSTLFCELKDCVCSKEDYQAWHQACGLLQVRHRMAATNL